MTEALRAREFEAATPRIVWGPGCTSRLEEEMARIGAGRALLLCGKSLGASDWFRSLHGRLGPKCAAVFAEVAPHTPTDSLRRAVETAMRHSVDCIVMIGGGSVTDAGKLVALTLAEGDDYESYKVRWTDDRKLAIPTLSKPKLPLIAVPTTLSAAEVVGAAAYVDGQKRYVIVDRRLLPRVVMYDAQLAATTPVSLFLGSGMNAIAHCIDAICSVKGQPFSEALALGALRELVAGLSRCAVAPADSAARERALIGAAMSGIAYTNTWLGIAHSFCQALGARYRTPQGYLHAVMLPHAMRFNLPATTHWQASIGRAIEEGMGSRAPAGAVEDASTLVARFTESLDLPRRLRDLDIPESELGLVAEDAFTVWHTYFNPRRVGSPDELRQVLADAW